MILVICFNHQIKLKLSISYERSELGGIEKSRNALNFDIVSISELSEAMDLAKLPILLPRAL